MEPEFSEPPQPISDPYGPASSRRRFRVFRLMLWSLPAIVVLGSRLGIGALEAHVPGFRKISPVMGELVSYGMMLFHVATLVIAGLVDGRLLRQRGGNSFHPGLHTVVFCFLQLFIIPVALLSLIVLCGVMMDLLD